MINRQTRFIVKWSPLLLAAAAVWLFLTLRRGPVSIPYLMVSAGIGLLCGGLIVWDFWKHPSPLLVFLWVGILQGGNLILRDVFFFDLSRDASRNTSSQYLSVVLVSVLGLVLALRQRIMRSPPETDVEQRHAADAS
jgi:hypothetical protein